MATISGPVRLPDGTNPQHGRIIFRRTTPELGQGLTVPGPVEAIITGGVFTIDLNAVAEGAVYAVGVEYWDEVSQSLAHVGLPDIVVAGDGPFTLAQVSTVQTATRDTYELHQGDTAVLPVTMLDANRRPVSLTDSTVSGWLERGDVRVPVTVNKVTGSTGLVQMTITAPVSAGLALGLHTAVIQMRVGTQVKTVRGKIKII